MEQDIKQIAYDYTTCKADAKKLEDRILSLFSVSQQRELLKAFEKYLNSNEAGYYTGEFRINEFLEAFNCG